MGNSVWVPVDPEPEGSYKVSLTCQNCGRTEAATFPKGQLISKQRCPYCGCRTLQLKGH